jgi:hypothetical protein
MAGWRDDIDALAFRPAGHSGFCMVHHLALRTVMGRLAPPEECLAWFEAHRPVFDRAAQAKITRAALPPDANFHLTSRDLSP